MRAERCENCYWAEKPAGEYANRYNLQYGAILCKNRPPYAHMIEYNVNGPHTTVSYWPVVAPDNFCAFYVRKVDNA